MQILQVQPSKSLSGFLFPSYSKKKIAEIRRALENEPYESTCHWLEFFITYHTSSEFLWALHKCFACQLRTLRFPTPNLKVLCKQYQLVHYPGRVRGYFEQSTAPNMTGKVLPSPILRKKKWEISLLARRGRNFHPYFSPSSR